MAKNKDQGAAAPDDFIRDCQTLWHKAMALAGDAYTRQREEMEGRLEVANREIRALREQIDPLVASRDSHARSMVELDKKLKDLQTQLNEERTGNEGMHAQFETRERDLKKALEDVALIEAKLREAEAETLTEAERRQVAEARVAELENNLQSNVQNSVGEVQSELNKVSSKLEVITAERDRLNRDLSDAFETIAMLEDRAKSAAAEGKSSGALEQKLHDLENEIEMLRRKNTRLNAECDEFAQKNAELLKRLQSAASV